MEKVLGIIAEYNPLHNGHIYHIKKSKEISGAKYTIAVMTGNFNQRGEPSIANKWDKAKMALASNEIDLVIELPTIYSLSSAENFASGGVRILNELGITDYISFGIEETERKDEENCIAIDETSMISDISRKVDSDKNIRDIKIIEDIAKILCDEPKEYMHLLKTELQKGISYPKARENAIANYTGDNRYGEILAGANNILGVEYLKALRKLYENGNLKRDIIPIAINRKNVNHDSMQIIDNYASGTEIRKLFYKGKMKEIKELVPNSSYDILNANIENGNYIFNIKESSIPDNKNVEDKLNISTITVFEKEIIYKIRMMSVTEIAELPEVTEGLEYRIKECASNTNNISELIESIKSKRYTQTRIQRILLYALLGITKCDMEMSKEITPYIRVLGFNEKGQELLSKMGSENIITSVKRFEESNTNEDYQRMIDIDKIATDIYTLAYKQDSKGNLDYTMRNHQSEVK